jgi:ABC-2 type transport system permease protein
VNAPAGTTAAGSARTAAGQGGAWLVVAARELSDLWRGGRGPGLLLAYTLLLSTTTYLVATNRALNFLEQREAVSLTLQVAVAFSALLVLVASADAVSGERERGTLEGLLLSPAPRRALVVGKGMAALSLWLAAWIVALPYVLYLGLGVGVVWRALVVGLLAGGLLSLALSGFGLLVSLVSRSNRISLTVALFSLLALYAPTQMPSAAQSGQVGDLLLRADPVTAALHYVGAVLVSGRGPIDQAPWLVGPLVLALLLWCALWFRAERMALVPGGSP